MCRFHLGYFIERKLCLKKKGKGRNYLSLKEKKNVNTARGICFSKTGDTSGGQMFNNFQPVHVKIPYVHSGGTAKRLMQVSQHLRTRPTWKAIPTQQI
ncbi:hypothetical protein NPIL_683791 [Nephila pilipes]|uniref:Uncharacterized protein n=1 Tax=Nephila pilipes TaxID=299642 RepID=A0A8X6Q6L5_NEPPI|nr:hypothetical protein NPIL_683791 [Nephila pilipes]